MNHNPLLDTRNYEVQSVDDFMEEMTANHLSDNMLSQVEYEENHLLFLKDITDHNKDAYTNNKTYDFLTIKSRSLNAKNTTRRWTLPVELNYSSVEWVLFMNIKHPNPL